MASFTADISAFVKKANEAPNTTIRRAFFDLSSRIIRRTPVDTGLLRNNWQAGVNAPKLSVVDAKSNPIASVESATGKKIMGDFTLYLNNNLPYAHRIEFSGWSRVKAPQGMVRVSIAEFTDCLKKATK